MRAALAFLIVPLVGCSQILGIQDPSAGDDGGRPDGGGGVDATPTGDHLQFSVTNFTIAKGQRVRFHVLLVREAGQQADVTLDPMLTVTSDLPNGTLGTDTDAGVRTFDGVTDGNPMLHAAYPGVGGAATLAHVTTFTCHPIINEFQTGGSAGGNDEFVELFNPCTTPQLVDQWKLVYRPFDNKSDVDTPLVTLAGTMAIGEVRLYGGPAYSGTTPLPIAQWPNGTGLADLGGSLGLRDAGATLIDSLGYGDATAANPFIEGTAALNPPSGKSMSRSPFDGRDDGIGGKDGDNSMNFALTTTPTPGALNFP